MKKLTTYFSKGDLTLWGTSSALILVSFFLFDRVNFMTLAASLIGTTSLIFNAKGNPFGQLLMVIFSLLYCVISYTFSYYGEMITYLGMTMPMAVFALISWLRNPYKGNRAEVKVNRISKNESAFMWILTLAGFGTDRSCIHRCYLGLSDGHRRGCQRHDVGQGQDRSAGV